MNERIPQIIEQYLRPLVEADGGSIELVGVEGKTIHLRLSGQCAGCPGKPYTLDGVCQPAIRHVLGPDWNVVAVD